jgi:hypothetical protein
MTTVGVVVALVGLVGITVGLAARDEDAALGRTRFTIGGVALALGTAIVAMNATSTLPGFKFLPSLALMLSSALVLRHILATDDEPRLDLPAARRPTLGAPTRMQEIARRRRGGPRPRA